MASTEISPIPPQSGSTITKYGSEENSIFKFTPTLYSASVNLTAPYPPNTPFPLAVSPSKTDFTIDELVTAAKTASSSGLVRDLLTRHGAIYFKDLSLKAAEEFSQFACAFGWTPHEDIGNPVRRTVHAFNVATANEGPNTQPVYPHNEFGLSPHYPAYLFFYCKETAETGITSSQYSK